MSEGFTADFGALSASDEGAVPADFKTPVGPVRRGQVIAKSDLGLGYIEEEKSGRYVGFSREYVGKAVFAKLVIGEPVSFRENGHNAVAVILTD